MDYSKAFEQFWELYHTNKQFQNIIKKGMENGQIRFFDDREWEKIKNQNFVSPSPEMKEFIDMFILGLNIGNCVGTSRQLSYSYNNASIVSGILPLLKGKKNSEKEGGHCWLETPKELIDTTLMLVMDKSLKKDLGYIEEQRLTPYDLALSTRYQARKEFVNDKNIKRNSQSK